MDQSSTAFRAGHTSDNRDTVHSGRNTVDSAVDRDEAAIRSTMLTLKSPRYVPCATADMSIAAWYDRQEDTFLALCPECHRLITYYSLYELYDMLVWSEPQCCQGCRARIAFLFCPRLVDMFLDFWCRTGDFPQSPSWVEAIPKQRCTKWADAIQAGLEAATAPMMDASTMQHCTDGRSVA